VKKKPVLVPYRWTARDVKRMMILAIIVFLVLWLASLKAKGGI
jgi:hypothetical protein